MTATPTTTAERYRRFAEVEARGYSPLYDAWCSGVAGDAEVLGLIDQLPEVRRQPNLLLGAARFLGVPLDDAAYGPFRSFLLTHWDGIRSVMESRTTQTNEAGRCAVLLPYLAAISASEDRPLALVEVGASAGACLYPDRYSYSYSPSHSASAPSVSGTQLRPDGGSPVPPLECEVSGEVRLPDGLPEVLWRAGIDLNPLDASDDGDRRWLEALVWPEHTFRAERLRAALDVVRADPPLLVRGDLVTGTADLVARAPVDTVVVVFPAPCSHTWTPQGGAGSATR